VDARHSLLTEGHVQLEAAAEPITERSATELARAVRARETTAREVVEAHVDRLRSVAPRINAIVADRFEAALAEADEADRMVASSSASVALPPLLGVPFTIKESIAVRGMPNAAGMLARRSYRSSDNAPTVQRLVDAGAIPLGVTNTSELTLWIESENPLYGRTSNPYDPARTAGGSSGGEGAAVGAGGAPFGLGSDIGGSIRIPGLFCGTFGHKPSAGLVPNTGMWPPTVGESGRMLAVGPLTRRAEDLMPLLRVLAGPDGVDPVARAVTLRDPAQVSLEGLEVVTVDESSTRPMTAEMREARERAAGALIAGGARLRRVKLRSWRRVMPAFLAKLAEGAGPDAANATLRLLNEAGEPRPTWRQLLRGGGATHTRPTRIALAAELLQGTRSAPPPARFLTSARHLVDELREVVGDGVLLHPVHPTPAPKHGRTVGRLWLLSSAAVFNLAGLPVTEVPLGLSAAGLPVGIQVAADMDRDHVSIAVALELERVFGGWIPPPGL
jgi:fatty acid amide hydrolase 2